MVINKICLASDNWSYAHPSILEAVMEANQGNAPAYGADRWTVEAQEVIQTAFNANCKVYFVPTGTGANILGLKLACRSYESIVCTDIAHINYQETGAPESNLGCKLLTVTHREGKISANEIVKKLNSERAFGKHSTSPRVLSIAQPTEVGTVYSLNELAELFELCKRENLLFHIDGSRLYNAAVFLKVSLEEMIKAANPDILSLGGTKNGLMGAEALLIFNTELEKGSEYFQKQTLQLLSKMRYLSAQYLPFFKNRLWHTLAQQANQKAQEIASIIRQFPKLKLNYEVETNQIFFTAPESIISSLQEKISCLLWNKEKSEIRFITSWNTSDEDVKHVKIVFDELFN